MTRVVSVLAFVALLSGCATVSHPDRPGVKYRSVAECEAHNPEPLRQLDNGTWVGGPCVKPPPGTPGSGADWASILLGLAQAASALRR